MDYKKQIHKWHLKAKKCDALGNVSNEDQVFHGYDVMNIQLSINKRHSNKIVAVLKIPNVNLEQKVYNTKRKMNECVFFCNEQKISPKIDKGIK